MSTSHSGVGRQAAAAAAVVILTLAWAAPTVAAPEPSRARPGDGAEQDRAKAEQRELSRAAAERFVVHAPPGAVLHTGEERKTVSAKAFVASQGKPGGALVLASQRARRADRATTRTGRRRAQAARMKDLKEMGGGPDDPCSAPGGKTCPPRKPTPKTRH
jgi:hypothetical protein